ncbi:FAD-dependent monooxygenase [Marinoscillum pacificum]|uniref:FAD-dependent monooxygenase n=1 Tax=Marinoscillum pacificum TaxID=392723 RepID=UPI002157D255|nr:FAD-dependent monooxygenase [Marinoscillum pacificum]
MEISIIGGGITGLTTALALHKRGIYSTVYEQADHLNEIGAGIWLQPNAVQVLRWLGIYDEVLSNGCILNKMEITYPNLCPIKKIQNHVVSDHHGNQTVAIHRGKLQQILYDQCAKLGIIELGMPYLHYETTDQHTTLHFKDKSVQTDIVLGADGIRSKVRESMKIASVYRPTGQICTRSVVTYNLPDHLKNEGKEVWGNKRRFGFSQLSDDSVYFFTVLNKEISPKSITKESLSKQFDDFDPIVASLINASGNMHTTELMDLKRLNTWHTSHACLLGDAAHATTPNMGQGACQGIEDAYYISDSLKKFKNPQEAFSVFEHQRRKKVDYVVNNSWRFGKLVHQRAGQLALRGMMKMTPEKVMSKQMNALYRVEGL